MMHLTKDKF